jgi:hypothetical protein
MSSMPLRLSAKMPLFSEARWLREGSFVQMLAFVRIDCRPGRRKQGLLLAGMCRLAESHLPRHLWLEAVGLGELLVRGRHCGPEQGRLFDELNDYVGARAIGDDLAGAAWARLLQRCIVPDPTYSRPLDEGVLAVAPVRGLLHDLFGNPFRPVKVDPAWLRRNDSLVAKMAHLIAQEGRFDDLPILADALEDAGCAEPEILEHCRSAGPHFRGCWVLDRLRLIS